MTRPPSSTCICWLVPSTSTSGRETRVPIGESRRWKRARIGVQVSPAIRLLLDGRILGGAWGRADGFVQRYLLLDDLKHQVVAVPESRLMSASLAMWGFTTNPPPAEPPTDFVAFSDASIDNPLSGPLPTLGPLYTLALIGHHVCSPGPNPFRS